MSHVYRRTTDRCHTFIGELQIGVTSIIDELQIGVTVLIGELQSELQTVLTALLGKLLSGKALGW